MPQNNSNISFPLQSFDISPYIMPRQSSHEAVSQRSSEHSLDITPRDSTPVPPTLFIKTPVETGTPMLLTLFC